MSANQGTKAIDPHELFKPGETYDENEAQIRLKIRQMIERKKAELDAMEAAKGKNAGNKNPAVPEEFQSQLSPSKDTLAMLPIALLDDFYTLLDRQPFIPYTREQFESLRVDISQRGILQPLIVRPMPNNRYEIIAGHNRRNAAKAIGYHEIPCIIRSLGDDEALLQFLSTNLQQREKLLPSEKAWAHRLRAEAMNRQGWRSDLREDETTSTQTARRPETADILGEESGVSGDTIRRLIRLTYLTPELLKQVDNGTLGLLPGAILSYIGQANQSALYEYAFVKQKVHISQALADTLRKADKEGTVFGNDTLAKREFNVLTSHLLLRYLMQMMRIKGLSKWSKCSTKQQNDQKETGMRNDEQLMADLLCIPKDDFEKWFPRENIVSVYKHIRLTYLIPHLLFAVDANALNLNAAVSLSFVCAKNQAAIWIYFFQKHEKPISDKLAVALDEADEMGIIFSDATLPMIIKNVEGL